MLATSSYRVDPLTQAVEYLNAGAGLAASICLAPLLRVEPGNPVALTLMGLALLECERPAEAEDYLRRGWAISPERTEIALHLARALQMTGQSGEAVTVCLTALAHTPNDEDLLEALAVAQAEDEAAREGWLKFGEPAPEFGPRFGPRRLVRPRPGRLVLFPPYLWHGATPFASDQSRMTIAFDVAPSAAHRGGGNMRH